jgi:hypothetical protein
MLRHLQKILHGFDFVYIVCVLLLICIMALKFYWWRQSEYPEKTINLANLQQVTYSCIDYSSS